MKRVLLSATGVSVVVGFVAAIVVEGKMIGASFKGRFNAAEVDGVLI